MKNIASDGDWVNLPPYEAGAPAGRLPSWSHRVKTLTPARAAVVARLRVLTQSEGLVGADLLAAFVARRVLPLQGRPHLISQMSDHQDPSRMCTREMPLAEVANMVNHITNCELAADWQFGKEPYSRANPPPVVSRISCCSVFFVAESDF